MNASDLSLTPPCRTAPPTLWRVAEAFMHMLYNLFGAPEDVAARHTLTGAAHALMAHWLRIGEALLRHLLVIEASAFARPNTRPLLHPSRKRTRKLIGFDADKPEAWRVSFRCFAGDTHARRAAGQDKHRSRGACVSPAKRLSREDRWSGEFQKRVTFRSAWPLAERYEAMLRVFNAPIAYARRLAARLHARPHRVDHVLRRPAEAEHQIDDFPALATAANVAANFFSSS